MKLNQLKEDETPREKKIREDEPVVTTPDAREEFLPIIVDRVNQAVENEFLLLGEHLVDVDLLRIADHVPEDPSPDAAVRRQPLQRRPPQRLLVVPILPKRLRSRRQILRRTPHPPFHKPRSKQQQCVEQESHNFSTKNAAVERTSKGNFGLALLVGGINGDELTYG